MTTVTPITIILLLALSAQLCLAQTTRYADRDVTASGYPAYRVFTDRDGLPQNTVRSIALDKKGYLWVGTQDGAAYYNGSKWIVVNMPDRNVSNWVTAILVSDDGSIFFGTNGGGLCRLKDGVWTVMNKGNSGLPNDFVSCLVETRKKSGDASIWIGTENGLAQVENGVWTVFNNTNSGLPYNDVLCLARSASEGNDDSLWIGTDDGLSLFRQGQWQNYKSEKSGLPSSSINAVLETRDEKGTPVLWAGTSKGLARLSNGEWKVYDSRNGLPIDRVYTLLESRTGNNAKKLWVGTPNGLALLENDHWLVYNTTNSGLPDNSILGLFQIEGEGDTSSIWVGTLGGGLVRWNDSRWISFDRRSGLPDNHVYSLLETRADDGGSIYWFGTYGGLARLEKGQWTIYNSSSGLPDNRISCLVETTAEDGTHTLWVGTLGGLARLEKGRWKVINTGLNLPNSQLVKSLLGTVSVDGKRRLWVGTSGGLACLENEKWTVYDTSSGLPDLQVQALLSTVSSDGKETLWVGTFGGLARFQDGRFTSIDRSSGLPNNLVRGLTETISADGRHILWVGTGGGGVAWLDLNDKEARWNTLSQSSSPQLPNNVIYGIRQDASGRIYLTSNKGVICLIPGTSSVNKGVSYNIYNFTTEDGLPSNECNGGASMVDSMGRIWVGTVAGAAGYDPSNGNEALAPARLQVERVLVNGMARSIDSSVLAHNENSIVLEFALLSFFKESETFYRSQLLGVDQEATGWTADHKREYPALPAGSYAFQVWGKDYAGNISGPIVIKFNIKPAPWRSWWAYLCYFLVLAGAIYSGVWFRSRNLRLRNQMLEATVKERTAAIAEQAERLKISEQSALEANRAKSTFLANMSHELRTPLNSILGFAQIASRNGNLKPEIRECIDTIIRSGEHLLNLINDVLSISKIEAGKLSLKEQSFNLHRLLHDLTSIFQTRAETKSLKFSCEVDKTLPENVRGDDGKLRQILINLLGNAVKFTESGTILLRAKWREGRGLFEVEDTGPGMTEEELQNLFEPFMQTESGQRAKEGAGLGLSISRNIARLMDGDITVKSEPGKGSLFRLEIDLPIATEKHIETRGKRVIGLEPGQQKYRILIVDDRLENRTVLSRLLSSVGFSTREAGNGKEAIEVWREWKPHLIWMDMRMRVMDGYRATEQIRRESGKTNGTERVVIIALTASAFEQDHGKILAAGCDDIVTKPYLESTIFEKLEERLKIRFQYEESISRKSSSSGKSGATDIDLYSGLKQLPPDLLKELSKAILQEGMDVILQTIDKIGKQDEPLAEELRQMAKAYRLDKILLLLQKI